VGHFDKTKSRLNHRVSRIISGGQTGVDRAALDVAIELGIAIGGWCPKGRRAEDGEIEFKYPLEETPSTGYSQRTKWNVRDSDGTLILAREPIALLTGGTRLTQSIARKTGKPWLVIHPENPQASEEIGSWIQSEKIQRLNIAGPRESQAPGISKGAHALLLELFTNSPEQSPENG